MIQMGTILEVADNSGARKLSCILPRGGDLGLGADDGEGHACASLSVRSPSATSRAAKPSGPVK